MRFFVGINNNTIKRRKKSKVKDEDSTSAELYDDRHGLNKSGKMLNDIYQKKKVGGKNSTLSKPTRRGREKNRMRNWIEWDCKFHSFLPSLSLLKLDNNSTILSN